MIDEIPYKCVCGENVLNKMREEHSINCSKVLKKCKWCNCQGDLEERVRHLIDAHSDVIVEKFSEIV